MKTLFSIFVICWLTIVSAEQNFHYQSQVVKGNLMMMTSKGGGNIALLTEKRGILVIDSGLHKNAAALQDALIKLDQPIEYLMNTHWHYDHAGGNAQLAQSTIVAHDKVYERLKSGGKIFDNKIPPHPVDALPDITYNDTATLHFGEQTVLAQHFANAHTDGDTVVFLQPLNVVHMGDLLFHERFPFVDYGSGGSVEGYIMAVNAVAQKIDADTIVIPGHGSLTNKEGLKNYALMLESTLAEVEALKQSGLSLQQAQEKGLAKKWQAWGVGFISEKQWIATLWKHQMKSSTSVE